ncbi:putative Polyketide synthase [Seiridium cardinale]
MMQAANFFSTQTLPTMATPRRVPVPPSSFWPPADAELLMKSLSLDIIDGGEVVPEFMAKAYAHTPRKSFAAHNHCSEDRYWLSDVTGMYKKKLGTEIDVLPTPEWMRKAKAFGMPKVVEAAWTGIEVFVPPVLRKGASDR